MKRYILKSGSWFSLAKHSRSAFRSCDHPIMQLTNIGLRLVIRRSYGPYTVSGTWRVAFRDIGFHWYGVKKRGFRFVI